MRPYTPPCAHHRTVAKRLLQCFFTNHLRSTPHAEWFRRPNASPPLSFITQNTTLATFVFRDVAQLILVWKTHDPRYGGWTCLPQTTMPTFHCSFSFKTPFYIVSSLLTLIFFSLCKFAARNNDNFFPTSSAYPTTHDTSTTVRALPMPPS